MILVIPAWRSVDGEGERQTPQQASSDQRTLTVAGDSIDTQLLKLIEERYPQANVTVFMVREWKEKYGA